MAAPVIATSATNEGSSNSATCNKPTGVAAGDDLVAKVAVEGGSGITVTPPAGWTAILASDNSSNVGIRTYLRRADGTEGASFAFGLSSSVKWCAGIARITGADEVTIAASAAGNGSSGNPLSPAVTPPANDSLILRFVTNKKAATYTTPADHTEVWDNPNDAGGTPSNALMSRTWAVGGTSTGTQSITASESAEWAAVTIAIAAPSGRPIVTTGTSSTSGTNVSSLTGSHTVPSGTNRLLIVPVSARNGSDVVTSVTFDGTALTRLDIGDFFIGVSAYLYYLIAPAETTADIVVTFSGSQGQAEAGAINITGAHQTTPFGTPVNNGAAAASSASQSVSSVSTELVIDVVSVFRASAVTLVVGAGQTERRNILVDSLHGLGVSTEPGVASNTMSWTLSSLTNWSGVAVAVKPTIEAPVFIVSQLSALGVG